MKAVSSPASSAVDFICSNSTTRSSVSATRSDPTCRQPGLASGSASIAEKVLTDHIANLTRSTLVRTCPTRPAACEVVSVASASFFSSSKTSVLPA